jgi:hypothetical protein
MKGSRLADRYDIIPNTNQYSPAGKAKYCAPFVKNMKLGTFCLYTILFKIRYRPTMKYWWGSQNPRWRPKWPPEPNFTKSDLSHQPLDQYFSSIRRYMGFWRYPIHFSHFQVPLTSVWPLNSRWRPIWPPDATYHEYLAFYMSHSVHFCNLMVIL